MRIVTLTTKCTAIYQDSLEPFELNRLGRVVVLTGPNGAGKTRVLNRIQNLDGEQSEFLHLGFEIEDLVAGSALKVAKYTLGTIQHSGEQEPDSLPPGTRRHRASHAESLGANNIVGSAPTYIQEVQNRWFEATHPGFSGDDPSKNQAIQTYTLLRENLASLLGANLERNPIGQVTLFGHSVASPVLSSGQQALLTWAAMLHAQGAKLGNVILVIDEPETHLHPDAVLEMLRKTIDSNTNGQIWIGTHSIPVLAGLSAKYRDEISLCYMSKGSASYAGRGPEKILASLMGGDENVYALREFLNLPELMAVNRFATECLLSPPVVSGVRTDDPQILLVENCLPLFTGNSKASKILDFGAGDGRLIETFAALHGPLDDLLDYVAWDIPDVKEDRCLVALKRAYRNSKCRRFTCRDELFRNHPVASFEAVLMCNVLHEIDPSEWINTFSRNGVIAQSLAQDGHLIIVEDYLMPKGEHANKYGFIVLNTESLLALFNVSSADDIQVYNARQRYANRIRAHKIPRRLLENVDSATRKKSLELAQEKAREQISSLRSEKSHTYLSGRSHAFWVQQFANTSLALSEL